MRPGDRFKGHGIVTVNVPLLTSTGEARFFYGELTFLSEHELLGFQPKEDDGFYVVINNRLLIPGCKINAVYFTNKLPDISGICEP